MVLCEWDAPQGDPGQSCVHLFARILSTSFSSVSLSADTLGYLSQWFRHTVRKLSYRPPAVILSVTFCIPQMVRYYVFTVHLLSLCHHLSCCTIQLPYSTAAVLIFNSFQLPASTSCQCLCQTAAIQYYLTLLTLLYMYLPKSRGRILGRNPGKNLRSFPPCYSQSPLQLCLEVSISSDSHNLLQFLQISYSTL
jgi:hypothetical protein